jgi:hypothetical protein
MPKRLRGCPNCGKQKKVECTLMKSDGALIDIKHDRSMWKVAGVPAKRWTQAEHELFFMELKAYGAAHGYKPGWALMKYRDKFIEFAAALVFSSFSVPRNLGKPLCGVVMALGEATMRWNGKTAAAGAATFALRHRDGLRAGLLRAKLRHWRAARRRPILH